MSHQTTLNNYFKSKALASPSSMRVKSTNKINKRRSLSLKRTTTPVKTPKQSAEKLMLENQEETSSELTPSKRQHVKLSVKKDLFPSATSDSQSSKRQIITLSDNDEDLFTQSLTPQVSSQSLDSSANETNSSGTTFVYNLSPGIVWQSPGTPSKSSQSPGSSKKFYSPTKKRIMNKKSPAKRNLANQFNSPESANKATIKKFENRDDKTVFFLSIIDKYLRTESLKHLLEKDSQVLLEKCLHVVDAGMRLMCRLYWRQPGWYRMEELEKIANGKKEVLNSPELYNTVTCLVEYGFITPAGSEGETRLDFDDYVKLLKKSDLQQICKNLKLKIQSKQDAVDSLRSFCKLAPISNFYTVGKVKNNRERVLEMLKSRTGYCYKLSALARTTFYNLYLLMYLGIDYSVIREKKLEWILILDKTNMERYPIDKEMVVDDASVVFQDREEFYRYLQAHIIYENYLEQSDTNEKCKLVIQSYNLYKELKKEHLLRYKLLPIWLRRFTPANIYVKILEKGVQELKKLKMEDSYKLAVEILDTLIGQIAFRQHKKAEWYTEKALILHSHLDSSEKAAKVLLEGFNSDLSEEAKDAMRPRARKIAKQQNIDLKETLREALLTYATKEEILESKLPGEHIYKQPMDNYNQRGKLKFEAHTHEGRTTLTAEDYCVFHYVSNGQYTHGEHWEGRIVKTIFFLLFWDIIYAKPRGVTGIFISHYQRYPLDMFAESFYINRKTLIDEQLLFIEECTDDLLMTMLENKWLERPECEISDIQRSIGWENVKMVTSCLGPRGVAAICRRLAHNYGYTNSGFPDLTLWNIHTKKIKFVEVKTDADKPSVKQLQWLQYLIEHGIDAGFCYVGVNTARPRARSGHVDNSQC